VHAVDHFQIFAGFELDHTDRTLLVVIRIRLVLDYQLFCDAQIRHRPNILVGPEHILSLLTGDIFVFDVKTLLKGQGGLLLFGPLFLGDFLALFDVALIFGEFDGLVAEFTRDHNFGRLFRFRFGFVRLQRFSPEVLLHGRLRRPLRLFRTFLLRRFFLQGLLGFGLHEREELREEIRRAFIHDLDLKRVDLRSDFAITFLKLRVAFWKFFDFLRPEQRRILGRALFVLFLLLDLHGHGLHSWTDGWNFFDLEKVEFGFLGF